MAQTLEALGGLAQGEREVAAQPAHWGGINAMTLCVSALIASEFMPVSQLTPMASDLAVRKGLIGQGIAISGVFAVLMSLSVSKFAGRMDRIGLHSSGYGGHRVDPCAGWQLIGRRCHAVGVVGLSGYGRTGGVADSWWRWCKSPLHWAPRSAGFFLTTTAT